MDITLEKKIAASLSIVSNTLVISLKLIAGIISGSISIISEALHSTTDFLASILTFFAVSRSSEPADNEHQFGHGKYEDMSGFIEGGLIIFAGCYIVYKSIFKLISGHYTSTETTLGIFVMGFAVLTNIIVSTYLLQIAKKTQSVSLYADGQHLKSDIYSSVGVLLGLIIIKYTGLTILDPIIALIVAVIIIKTGFSISKETLNNLLDGSLPEDDLKRITAILKSNDSFKGYKDLKTRKSGKVRDIEITLLFNPELKLCDCHKVCDDVENQIKAVLTDVNITIHLEPICYNTKCHRNNCSIEKIN